MIQQFLSKVYTQENWKHTSTQILHTYSQSSIIHSQKVKTPMSTNG